MNKIKSVLLLCFLAVLPAGCVSNAAEQKSEVDNVAEPVPAEKKKEVVSWDFKRAVQTAVRNMLQSGALDNPTGERYIVSVSYIVDTTKMGFSTTEIKQKLSADLAAGRKVRVVSTTSKNVTPQLIIAGRITQRTAHVRGGKKRQEYYLNLVLTEAKSGIKLWENATPIVKKKETQK
ncbi:MAG: hypothetical protein J5787_06775 [Alphaproteobacteria bacterium]|nr:hypothetical protein [Alphaproteobacteria bacterium]MBO4644284.1 hypothetical protein [Alphaproteobacteria bacterium]